MVDSCLSPADWNGRVLTFRCRFSARGFSELDSFNRRRSFRATLPFFCKRTFETAHVESIVFGMRRPSRSTSLDISDGVLRSFVVFGRTTFVAGIFLVTRFMFSVVNWLLMSSVFLASILRTEIHARHERETRARVLPRQSRQTLANECACEWLKMKLRYDDRHRQTRRTERSRCVRHSDIADVRLINGS